ncbi:hypothetical protein [Halomarina oriensis]|uniref:Uncharacterized protein n=1 Tax=Halomarina oriensis TaxID=671145 RepID=A0A6B0GIU8_9EURY|nr:hypothetical protein [Halomarina oriensis]MWG34806.1 hypothetical protein [Halomarina oriensis]
MATTETTSADENSTASLRIPPLPVAKAAAEQHVRARVSYLSRRTGTIQYVEGRVVECAHGPDADRGQYTLTLATTDGREIIAHATLREVHSKTDACLTRLGNLTAIEPAYEVHE